MIPILDKQLFKKRKYHSTNSKRENLKTTQLKDWDEVDTVPKSKPSEMFTFKAKIHS